MSSGEYNEALQSMQHALQLSPRNEQYLFNLSQIYLATRKVEEAVNVLRSLKNSRDPQVAARAQDSMQGIAKMNTVLQAMSKRTDGGLTEVASTSNEDLARRNGDAANSEYKSLPPDPHQARFLKGKLLSVDCSAAPSALLPVIADKKTWKMKVLDTKHIVVIGADTFSCEWTNQRIALNYRDTRDGQGDVISVEIQ